jgi:hypothetical protein
MHCESLFFSHACYQIRDYSLSAEQISAVFESFPTNWLLLAQS